MKKKLFFEVFFPITCIIGLSISKINLNIFNLSQLSGLAYHLDFLDKEKFKSPMCCNPKQKIKYFDEKGNVVTSYD